MSSSDDGPSWVDPGPGGADRPADGSVSRPSMNNRQGHGESRSRRISELGPSDLPEGTGLRPISVREGTGLRDEAVLVETADGPKPLDRWEGDLGDRSVNGRPVYGVVNAWRDWYDGYRNAHIEFEDPDGETVRTRLENSFQPEYGKRYYGKLKDFERGVERTWEDLSTVMLTFSASSENAKGGRRCPADHMRDIADGWGAARKHLHRVLDGFRWEYARVWEPHPGDGANRGYGHLHVAVFLEDPDGAISGETFRPVMRNYVRNVDPAGSEAHGLNTPGLGDAVSVNRGVENLGTYISEYIGIFGEEPTERPVSEQMFYATAWATGTRRVDFSNGAHELIAKEHFRRETGLRPEDRGGESFDSWRGGDGGTAETDARGGAGGSWSVESICTVRRRSPTYSDPTAGGVRLTPIDGRSGVDPPPVRD